MLNQSLCAPEVWRGCGDVIDIANSQVNLSRSTAEKGGGSSIFPRAESQKMTQTRCAPMCTSACFMTGLTPADHTSCSAGSQARHVATAADRVLGDNRQSVLRSAIFQACYMLGLRPCCSHKLNRRCVSHQLMTIVY